MDSQARDTGFRPKEVRCYVIKECMQSQRYTKFVSTKIFHQWYHVGRGAAGAATQLWLIEFGWFVKRTWPMYLPRQWNLSLPPTPRYLDSPHPIKIQQLIPTDLSYSNYSQRILHTTTGYKNKYVFSRDQLQASWASKNTLLLIVPHKEWGQYRR